MTHSWVLTGKIKTQIGEDLKARRSSEGEKTHHLFTPRVWNCRQFLGGILSSLDYGTIKLLNREAHFLLRMMCHNPIQRGM